MEMNSINIYFIYIFTNEYYIIENIYQTALMNKCFSFFEIHIMFPKRKRYPELIMVVTGKTLFS